MSDNLDMSTWTDAEKALFAQQMQQFQELQAKLPPTQTQKFKIDLGSGPIEFNTHEEMQAAVQATLKNAEQYVNNAISAVSSATKPPEPAAEPNAFDKQKFFKSFEEDPVQAFDQLLNHTIFGGALPQAAPVLRETVLKTAEVAQLMVVEKFKAENPDYIVDPQNAATLDAIRQRMELPITTAGLQAAYEVGKRYNLLKTGTPNNNTDGNNSANPNNFSNFTLAPPVPTRTSPEFNNEIAINEQLENMPLEDLERLILRMGNR